MKTFLLFILFFPILLKSQHSSIKNKHARHSEDWVARGIIYEIYPRAFSKEGTFKGIEQKLPELKKLGITILWLMPIHPVGEEKRKGRLGSPYSIKDYYGINPEFGDLDDFKRLVNSSHTLGFKIIIDLVANHTSWDSKMFVEHPEWFTKDSADNFISPVADWSDVVDLNYDNVELRRHMIGMMKYWVRDIGIDGFRCDVAEMIPVDFWNDARASLDSIKPVMMLSEGQLPEHHLKAFDVTYSWNFYHAIAPVLKGEKSATEFDSILIREREQFPKGALRMRFSSNHDENAWDMSDIEKFGLNGAMLAAVLVNTFPGIPLLYNGQEEANTVKLGLFEKFDIDRAKGTLLREFYTKLCSVRKKNPALCIGDYQNVVNNQRDDIYTFIRTDGKNTILAAFNFSDRKKSADLVLPKIFSMMKFRDAFTGKPVARASIEKISLPKFGYRLLVVE